MGQAGEHHEVLLEQKYSMRGKVPETSYGILKRVNASSGKACLIERVRRQGFAIYDPGFDQAKISTLSRCFDTLSRKYYSIHDQALLRSTNEEYIIRAMLSWSTGDLCDLALHSGLLDILGSLFDGAFVLHQQNGIINPPGGSYSQGSWHRDFPYQHFVSDATFGISALYCVDDFSINNGSTWVLPASHKFSEFPSQNFVNDEAKQLEVPAGSYLLMDCMMFHSGGINSTKKPRRAINHVYTTPLFKQPISLNKGLNRDQFSEREQAILGFQCEQSSDVESYLLMKSRQNS